MSNRPFEVGDLVAIEGAGTPLFKGEVLSIEPCAPPSCSCSWLRVRQQIKKAWVERCFSTSDCTIRHCTIGEALNEARTLC